MPNVNEKLMAKVKSRKISVIIKKQAQHRNAAATLIQYGRHITKNQAERSQNIKRQLKAYYRNTP